LAIARNNAGIEERIASFTGGLGADAVIITAGTDSLDPINFAGQICRKKGKVVIVVMSPRDLIVILTIIVKNWI
jgi:threonine dehydrogenase-like Zn-dependent dehydrogenase